MSQPTYFIPCSFARSFQDPQSRPDSPTPAPSQNPTPAPAGGGAQPVPAGPSGPNGVPQVGGPDPGKKPPAQGPCANDEMMWLMFALPVLMYFMMIRPEQKRKKEQTALLNAVSVGENVVMLSGMHGVITALDEKTVTIRAGDSNITFDRSAISRIVRDEPAPEAGK